MLQAIAANTPPWVWALLAFLVYRGILASTDREVAWRKVLIVPLVMLLLSVEGTASAFDLDGVTAALWLLAFGAGGGLAWRRFDAHSLDPRPQRGTLLVRGSWQPLLLMMAIFATKYTVGVLLALQPELATEPRFAAGVCALYGFFSGVFVGRLLRILGIYRAAQAASGSAPTAGGTLDTPL